MPIKSFTLERYVEAMESSEGLCVSCGEVAGYDFVELARDRKHFSLYRRLWPWDHAAGTLIYQEAGGHVARIDGRPYNSLSRVWRLLCAPDQRSWQQIHDHLSNAD